MTLSNFDWTDKTSERWFILLPTGHEGPYDLLSVRKRCQQGLLGREVKLWAEGLKGPVTAEMALLQSEVTQSMAPLPESPPHRAPSVTVPGTPARSKTVSLAHQLAEKLSEEAEIPPLPGEEIPPLPSEEEEVQGDEEEIPHLEARQSNFAYFFLGVALLGGLTAFFAFQWIKGQESVSVRRYPRMSVELHQRINKDLTFKGWGGKIFFKEYVPADLSQIWLVTASFQSCEVEAGFHSVQGKLLSVKDESVSFKATGRLENHVVEFSAFNFSLGTKVLPGMYEMDVVARNCEWDGAAANLSNFFRPVEKEYTAKTKVVLYPNGAAEFNNVLANLLKKKDEKLLKEQSKEQMFWQDIQQKFQTLLAISLQIEQHLMDFLQEDPKDFSRNLRLAVDTHTKQFGHFLTNFVVANETYFGQLGDLNDRSRKKNYEVMVNSTSKRIGEGAMRLIGELQKMKKPSRAQLMAYEERLKKTFSVIKEEINQKIILISEERPI